MYQTISSSRTYTYTQCNCNEIVCERSDKRLYSLFYSQPRYSNSIFSFYSNLFETCINFLGKIREAFYFFDCSSVCTALKIASICVYVIYLFILFLDHSTFLFAHLIFIAINSTINTVALETKNLCEDFILKSYNKLTYNKKNIKYNKN